MSCSTFHDFGLLFPLISSIKRKQEETCHQIREPGWDGKYELHPLLLCRVFIFFFKHHFIAADTCAGINDRAIKAEHTSHLHSLGPGFLKGLSSYRNSSFFMLAIADCSSPRGYTWEHWFSLKSVQVNTYPVKQLKVPLTEDGHVAV